MAAGEVTPGSGRIVRPSREDQLVAWLAALAITVHLAEAALPMPLPGVKPGLANVVTIVSLLHLGWRAAAWVSLLRVLGGSLLLGTFLTPTFILSVSGAAASVGVLALAWPLARHGLSGLGYSVLAALGHMGGQFGVAFALFIPHPAMLHLLPILMTFALLTGIMSGIIATAVIQGVRAENR
ncbi:MAG: Gx transporter family protein [Gammaproteobacteria bacterium]|nr:Gx transporter family protein [Gammaproteobacteria bacterium]